MGIYRLDPNGRMDVLHDAGTGRLVNMSLALEFASLFRVTNSGYVVTGQELDDLDPTLPHLPDDVHVDDVDVPGAIPGWEAVSGYTGQHGYRGALMHPSEYFGGHLAFDTMMRPGLYGMVEPYFTCENYETGELTEEFCADSGECLCADANPAGWTLLRATS